MTEDKRLLIIDADLAICYVVKQVAEGLGFTVCVCRNPEQFRQHARDWRPTAIMVDLRLVGLESLELLRRLGESPWRAPVIVNCGYDKKLLAAATGLAAAGGLHLAGVLKHPLCLDNLREMLTTVGAWRRAEAQIVAHRADARAEAALQDA